MPVEGVNGILNVESSALHAPRWVSRTPILSISSQSAQIFSSAETLRMSSLSRGTSWPRDSSWDSSRFTPPSISRLSPLLGTSPRTRFNSITPRQGSSRRRTSRWGPRTSSWTLRCLGLVWGRGHPGRPSTSRGTRSSRGT